MIKLTLISVLFGFFLTPNVLLDAKEENIVGEWQVIKYEVFDDATAKEEQQSTKVETLNSKFFFLEDNTGIQASSLNELSNYKWHLDRSKDALVLHNTSIQKKDKFFLKSVSQSMMVLEKHDNHQVVVSLLMKKL